MTKTVNKTFLFERRFYTYMIMVEIHIRSKRVGSGGSHLYHLGG